MAKKPAIQDYAADADVTSAGNTEAVIEDLEAYISDSVRAEMEAGAALVKRAQDEAAMAQLVADTQSE